MGRQFHVYLLPSDAIKLIEILQGEVTLRLLDRLSSRPEPTETETPVHIQSGSTRVGCLLTPGNSTAIKLDHLEKQGLWSISTLFSEVVELSGCHFDEKTLKRGRFFYDPGFYSDEQWQEKSPRFVEWAEAIFKTAKRVLKRVPSLDAYVGEDAQRWQSEGGVFIELAIKGMPPVVAKMR